MNEDTCTNFWGDKDTSISFCEQKYDQVFWIAEYYNTLSSFSYIIACLPFINTKKYKIAWSGIGIGVGSIMLHGSMRYYGQWVDEISMIMFSYHLLRYVDARFPSLWRILVPIYLVQWRHFLIMVSFFSSMQIRTFNILLQKKENHLYLYFYSLFFCMGFTCWLLDQFFCPAVQEYQLHAFWHIFTSISIFLNIKCLKD